MPPLPHPQGNGTRPASPDRRPATPPSGPLQPAAGGVSRLDRVTLQLGVAVAVVIAVCSYAVSATSLYALGVQAGYSWWQAAAVPVVADGPAIYGMSGSSAAPAAAPRARATAGYLSSADRGVDRRQRRPRPPQPGRQAIAAAIPLAVLAMLEGLKGDAGEVTRLAAQTAAGDAADTLEPAGQLPQATTVRRSDRPTNQDQSTRAFSPRRRALPAGPEPADNGTVGARLQAAYALPRPDGQAWTARTLAEAAGCGRSSAANFLQRHRPPVQEPTP